MTTNNNDELAALTDLARGLIVRVDELNHDSGKQLISLSKETRANRRMIWALTGSFILDVLLTFALGFGFHSLSSEADRVDHLTDRLDTAQTVQRQKALCPLYQLFLDSKSPEGRAASPDPAKYDAAFKTIEEGYKALACSEFVTGGKP